MDYLYFLILGNLSILIECYRIFAGEARKVRANGKGTVSGLDRFSHGGFSSIAFYVSLPKSLPEFVLPPFHSSTVRAQRS